MKRITQLGLALVSSVLASTVVASFYLLQSDYATLSAANAYAQASDQGQGETPSPDKTLQVTYTQLGVMSGAYQRVLYDSVTNTLGLTNTSATTTADSESGKIKMSTSQDVSQTQSNKKISETDQANLRQAITNGGLFEANDFYPAAPAGNQDYTLSVLSVTMDNRPRTVVWTSTSENVPPGLTSIAKMIEDIASK